MKQELNHWADILIIALYFAFVLAVGLWSLCRPNRGSVKGYFLAGRDMVWWPVGASLFASNIGSEHFIGLAGTGAASGIALVMYEWSSMILVLFLGWLFLPVYLTAGVYTLPEFLERRFKRKRLRIYLSCLALILYVITKIAVSIFAGAIFIQLALGWNMYLSIVLLLLITSIYTALGGLAAVIYTDTLQTVIMTIGAVIMCIMSFVKIGGMEGLVAKYMEAIPEVRNVNSTCGLPRKDAFNIFRDPISSDNPWPGLLLQTTFGCFWYWCADQVIVQRALAAKNVAHAKAGCILAGYLKLLPLFLMVFPGMISRALYPNEVGCVDPEECKKYCDNEVGCSNIAYPWLVMNLLPVGLRGLLLAVMMSAIMSSLTSIFNSSSTLFTMDLWRRFRPRATQRELLIVGRVCITVLCVVSVLWVPLVQSSAGGQLFVYIQAIQGYLGTAIGPVFLLAILWKRATEPGAFYGLMAGHTCGLIRMVLDFVYPAPQCGDEDTRPDVVAKVHYTYYGQLIMVVTVFVMVVVSLYTEPVKDEELHGVTWWTKDTFLEAKPTDLENNDIELKTTEIDPTDEENCKDDTPKSLPLWKRGVNFLCGIPESRALVEEPISNRIGRLKENKTWRTVLDLNAVAAVCVMAFLLGFFR